MKKYNYAKINLSLNVINKNKPKDFHELDMINFTINLKDSVSIKFIENSDDLITISCNNSLVPIDKNNIVYKVVEKFKKTYKLSFSCIVYINKKIPLQAGLAGGTGNAVATLDMLDKKFKTNMSVIQKMKFMESIASDGPYMVASCFARVKGKGEKVIPFKTKFNYKVVIIKPKQGCSTKDIFASLDYKNMVHPNITKIEQGLKDNDFNSIARHTNNSLTNTAINQNAEILDVINRLKTSGFEIVSMSGSGSTVFAISNKRLPYKTYKKIINPNNYDLVGEYKIRN